MRQISNIQWLTGNHQSHYGNRYYEGFLHMFHHYLQYSRLFRVTIFQIPQNVFFPNERCSVMTCNGKSSIKHCTATIFLSNAVLKNTCQPFFFSPYVDLIVPHGNLTVRKRAEQYMIAQMIRESIPFHAVCSLSGIDVIPSRRLGT